MASPAEVAGVVAGGVFLFAAISLIPIIIMWHHRRRAAARRSNELQALREHGCIRQVSVENWLEEQQRETTSSKNSKTSSHHLGQYAQEPCSICLSTLLPTPSQPSLPCSDPESLGAAICAPEATLRDRSLLVLNRCNHAFHYSCLASWWERRPYSCPICQRSYAPEG